MNKITSRPLDAHLDHPAFDRIVDGWEDSEGRFVLWVQYRTDHADYEGGAWLEAYDASGELLHDEPADDAASEIEIRWALVRAARDLPDSEGA